MEKIIDEKYIKRRNRARKRKRKRQVISIVSLFLLIFIVGSCSARKIHNRELSKINLSYDMSWYISRIKAYNKEKKLFDKSDIAIIPLKNIDSLKDRYLVKNSNHFKCAESYAYDTKKINSYILNNSYKGTDKIVFLTFDDGPNTYVTPQILKVLREKKVHATFFLVGKSINKTHANVVHQILNEGNAIANHSFSHDYSNLYPKRIANPSTIIEEVNLTNERLREIFGKDFKTNCFRYPGGHMSWKNTDASDSLLEANGIFWIDWNTLVGDAEKKSLRPTTAKGQLEYVKNNLKKNTNTKIAVVLAHDSRGKELTVEALPHIIDYFKNQGYKFGVLK